MPRSLQDLSFQISDGRVKMLAVKAVSPNHWTTGAFSIFLRVVLEEGTRVWWKGRSSHKNGDRAPEGSFRCSWWPAWCCGPWGLPNLVKTRAEAPRSSVWLIWNSHLTEGHVFHPQPWPVGWGWWFSLTAPLTPCHCTCLIDSWSLPLPGWRQQGRGCGVEKPEPSHAVGKVPYWGVEMSIPWEPRLYPFFPHPRWQQNEQGWVGGRGGHRQMPSCRRPGGFCSEPSASTFSLQKHRTDEQSGLVRGAAQTHSRASHTSELLRSRHLAQLTSKTSRKIHPRSNHLFFQNSLWCSGGQSPASPFPGLGGRLPLASLPCSQIQPGSWKVDGLLIPQLLISPVTTNGETNGADRGPPRSSCMWGQAQALHKQIAPWALDFRMGRLRRIWDQAAPRLSLPFSGGSSSESSGCIS